MDENKIDFDTYNELAFMAATFHKLLVQLQNLLGEDLSSKLTMSPHELGRVDVRIGAFQVSINLSFDGSEIVNPYVCIGIEEAETGDHLDIFPDHHRVFFTFAFGEENPRYTEFVELQRHIRRRGPMHLFDDWLPQQLAH